MASSTSILSPSSFPSFGSPAQYSLTEQSVQDTLCIAAWNNQWNQVQELLQNGQVEDQEIIVEGSVNMDSLDSRNFAAIHYASSSGNVEMTEALLAVGCSNDVRDQNGNTPLLFVASQALDGEGGYLQTLMALIEHGANPNIQNYTGETALHLACLNGNLPMVSFLTENGALVNCKTMDGCTPLHFAVTEGHQEVISYLLAHGAFVNAQDEEGDSVLHYAVRSYSDHKSAPQIVQLLLKSGADVDVLNDDEESSMELARQIGEDPLAQFLSQFSRRFNYLLVATKQQVVRPFSDIKQFPVATTGCMESFTQLPIAKNEGSALSSFHGGVQVPMQQTVQLK